MSDPRATVLLMQSEQRRQWRRERKRLEREEKRRNLRPPPGDATIFLQALPPMGETLLEYARPLMSWLPEDHGPEELQALLGFVRMFWNAVLEEGEVEEAVLLLARRLIEKHRMPLRRAYRLSEMLLNRRVQLFGDDPRIVTTVEVSRDGGGVRRRAPSTRLDEDRAQRRQRRAHVAR